MKARSTPLALALGLCACGHHATSGTDGTTPTDTGGGDTTTTFEGFVPYAFGVDSATFAVDADGRAVPYVLDGETVPVTVSIVLADVTVQTGPATPANSCHVTFTSDTPLDPAPWSSDTPALAAWSLPSGGTVTDDCGAFEFPPSWSDGPETVLQRWQFGFGLGALDADVSAQLPTWFGPNWEDYEPYVAGAGYYWDGLATLPPERFPQQDWLDGWVDTSIAYAYQVDDAFTVQLSAGQPIAVPAEDVFAGGGPLVARYDLQATTLLTPGKLLLEDPR